MTSETTPIRVEVYADLACPWCRLGTHRFHRAVEAFGGAAELVHLPYQLAADAPQEARPLMEAMAEMFGREQAALMTSGMTELGAGEGVEYRFDRAVAVNTFAAHRLLWFTLREYGAGAQARLATAPYESYFRDGGDLGDHAVLSEAAARAGVQGAGEILASAEGVTEVREQVAAARAAGITAVPTFVFPGAEPLSGSPDTATLLAALRRSAGTSSAAARTGSRGSREGA
ncbi:DsbA family oxidoreductase [Nonomuraea guangzhouensis]|uniref:DsbA family protein n=1 Tax=Nonomuraea guangzhouensis TaxID=1291555 RepID=A0ABW4GF39_9ACTN|nr:DsbA family oxidoreductase [Nonomuraea guangzhouensis]